MHHLMSFAEAVHVRRMVEGIAVEPKQTFWILTLNLLFQSATIEWCKVFGSWKEQTHWTRAMPEEDSSRLRADLLAALQVQPEEWKNYQEKMVEYRDRLVAHHDLNATVDKNPVFDLGLSAASFIFDRLRERADQDWLGGIPLSLDRWARGIAANMAPIVLKSFSASSVLGPNVPHT